MPRLLTIFFPDGTSEFWMTARVFEVGDKLTRNGLPWTVVSITTPVGSTIRAEEGDERHTTISLRADDFVPPAPS